MAQQLGATPHFLYLPRALPESREEKEVLCSTEVYRRIYREWELLDTALVNIGDYPSSPDFASLVRYGSLLQQRRACGRMLIYYFNEDGYVIQSDQDFAIQIPIDVLKRCPKHYRCLLCKHKSESCARRAEVRLLHPNSRALRGDRGAFGTLINICNPAPGDTSISGGGVCAVLTSGLAVFVHYMGIDFDC